jgi:hypothetical protein
MENGIKPFSYKLSDWLCMQYEITEMLKTGTINNCSRSLVWYFEGLVAYVASKHGVTD